MPRQPKLRKKTVGKSTYWFTKTGGETYLGKVEEVSYKDAQKLFADHLVKVREDRAGGKPERLTAGELMDQFLDWVQGNRSDKSYKRRRNHCSRFGAFKVGTRKTRVADLPADGVCSQHLEAWLKHLKEKMKLGPQTLRHAETSIKHCWNWATEHPSPRPYFPPTFRPFSAVERTVVPRKRLREDDLMTIAEQAIILQAAAIDPDQFRRYGCAETLKRKGLAGLRRTEGQVGCFADLMRCYLETGARTDELAAARVEDFQQVTGQLTLSNHKRSKTEKVATDRQIILNAEARAVIARQCAGRQPEDPIFTNSAGRAWTTHSLDKRFKRVKELAVALGLGRVRDKITIYSFRHLWISDALMAGIDIALVARMAGTSITMVEQVYGRFRNSHMQEAQEKLDQARRQRGASSADSTK